jgi:hypothetical protein
MARRYSRDRNGRFASAASGGATSRGARLGGKGGAPQARTSGLSAPKGTIARGMVNRSIGATRGMASGTKVSAAAKPASKPPAKMAKAAPNKAKQAYKAAKSQAREMRMYRGGRTDAVVKAAERKVARMEAKRGVRGRKKG